MHLMAAVAVIGVSASLAMAADPPARKPAGSGAKPAIRDLELVLDNAEVASVNMDPQALEAWKKAITEAVRETFINHTGNRDVLFFIRVPKGGAPEYQLGARSAFDPAEREKALARLRQTVPPAAKLVDYELAIKFKLNQGGPAGKEIFDPPIVFPGVQYRKKFIAAGLAEKKKMLENFAGKEALPVLAAIMGRVDPKFEGLRTMSKTIQGLDLSKPVNVGKVCVANYHYWRAMVETPRGDQAVPLARILVDIVNGRMDWALREHIVVFPFSTTNGVSHHYLAKLQWMLGEFARDIDKAVSEARALAKTGKHKEALSQVDKALAEYPYSAKLHFIKYQTSLEAAGGDKAKAGELWPLCKRGVLDSDPLYPFEKGVFVPDESFWAKKRMEIPGLFQNKDTMKKDLVNYADISLTLEQLAFSAQLYWYISNFFKPEVYDNRNMVSHFLYCMEKMGAGKMKSHFAGQWDDEIRAVGARMWKEQNP
jgi:hypothetical protein